MNEADPRRKRKRLEDPCGVVLGDQRCASSLVVDGVTKRFDGAVVVDDLDLEIQQGEFFCLLGGSGSGKTTLLRLIAGFEMPDAGRLLIDGSDMSGVPPYRRPVNMMFQSYALFPHMTVADNIGYGLRREGRPNAEIRARVAEMLGLVKLEAFAGRKPHQLSGGQQQRVALARSLVKRPQILLLDEPLGALDKKLREETQLELVRLQRQLGITFIVVTHDQDEAMTMATRIGVMDRGRIMQIDAPRDVYEFPTNRFVAGFFGTTNIFEAIVLWREGAVVRLMTLGGIELQIDAKGADVTKGQRVWYAIRPEKIRLCDEPSMPGISRARVCGKLVEVAYKGGVSILHVRLADGQQVAVSETNAARADTSAMKLEAEFLLTWDVDSGVLLTS